ncbi:MAG TPA: permease [Streptosporangiaceae bacterium]|jgi:hypothetical protein
MTAASVEPGPHPRHTATAGVVGVSVLGVLLVAGLAWAKWVPYAGKIGALSGTHAWPGGAIFASSGNPGAAPTFAGAWHFTVAYFQSIWPALVVALVVAAAVDALVPRAWLGMAMNRRTRFGQAAAAGTAALPSMMCTCCTAPVAVGLRRCGVTTAASLAYWIGNPLLNPAVLAFLFLVGPWQLGTVRIVVGAALVFAAAPVIARLFGPGDEDRPRPDLPDGPGRARPEPIAVADLPARYARSLARFAVMLVPEYVAAVALIGWLSGWLSSFDSLDAKLGVLAVVVVAVIGTLLVIPTGGEIPVVLALAAAGASAGTVGALLITLPALSIPSIIMVGRALSWRVTAATAAAVAVAGLLAGLLLWTLA